MNAPSWSNESRVASYAENLHAQGGAVAQSQGPACAQEQEPSHVQKQSQAPACVREQKRIPDSLRFSVCTSRIAFLLAALEVLALIAVPLALAACAYFQVEQAALLSVAVAVVAISVFFASFEASRPALCQIMPTVVLAALAAAGRMLFAPIPGVKPVSAICILAGAVFGRRSGFMVGALAALVSNFFFGQGPWTPWQMYAWGLVGYLAGVMADRGWFDRPWVLYVFGFMSALLYGLMLNGWYIIGFVHPLTLPAAILAFGAALPFDALHGLSTVTFLVALYLPWRRKLERIKRKHDVS